LQEEVMRSIASDYYASLRGALAKGPPPELSQVVEVLFAAFLRGATAFTLGNGGSAALAAHMACDLGKGSTTDISPLAPGQAAPRLNITSLSGNSALLTAYANDLGYESVFVEQLRSLLDEHDVVIAISGSGASPNVLRAMEHARARGATTIGFTGAASSTAALATRCDITVRAPLTRIEQVEDLHVTFNHVVALMLRQRVREHLSARDLAGIDGDPARPGMPRERR
jgi:D-sedoheptulose 7-phosphate isomerase